MAFKKESANETLLPKKTKNKRLPKNYRMRRVLIITVSFLLIVLLVAYGEFSKRYSLKEGEIAEITIHAPKDVENRLATEKLKQEVANRVDDVYERDENVSVAEKEELADIFNKIRYIRAEEGLSTDEKLAKLQETLPFQLTLESYRASLDATTQQFTDLEYQVVKMLDTALEMGFKEADMDSVKADMSQTIQKMKFSLYVRTLAEDILFGVMKPNIIYNESLTQQNKAQATSQVSPVIIQKGSVIVEKGSTITDEQIAVLEDLDMLLVKDNYQVYKIIFYIAFVAIIYGVAGLYLYIFKREIYRSTRYILLLNVVVVMTLLLARIFADISIYSVHMAMTLGMMLLGILMNSSMAIVLSIFMGLLVGVVAVDNIYILSQCLLSSIVGVMAINRTTQRSKMTNAGMILAGFNAVLTGILQGLQGEVFLDILQRSLISGVSGFAAAIFLIGVLPFFENWFNITTSFKLLELANPNHPLLKKLMMEAPGTYHHSVLVANLAEAAAGAVHGNEMLARVGAYYHDIGKMKRPGQFVENQLGGPNPHNKYTPALSTLIISSHVKDGLEYAKQYRLPEEICDIIREHHGDSLLVYFYHKAKELDPDKEIPEENFRYEGPKPQTKEAALIMLADSVEAATRAMSDPTKGKIDGLTRKIIKGKLNDGQLDECDITLKDLDEIAKSFSKVLEGIYHSRIEYPSEDEVKKDRG